MSELDNFLPDTGGHSLEDFVPEHKINPVTNEASNTNLAAHTALLSSDPVESFKRVSSELADTGASPRSEQIMEEYKATTATSRQNALKETLLDPELADEAKQMSVDTYAEELASALNMRKTLAEEMIIADNPRESVEAEVGRVSLAGVIDTVWGVKREQQALVNAEIAAVDYNSQSMAADLLQMTLDARSGNLSRANKTEDIGKALLPFVESKAIAGTISELRGGDSAAYGKALLYMGEAKEEIRNMLDKASPDKRLELTQKVIDAVNGNSAFLLPDDNDFLRMRFLDTFVTNGAYSDGERWLDNIISILDVSFLGQSLSTAVRTAKANARFAEFLKMSSNFEAPRPASTAMTMRDTNPDKFRNAFNAAELGGESESKALSGTTRKGFMGDSIMPDIGDAPTGGATTVRNKVTNAGAKSDQAVTPSGELMDFVKTDGKIYYWEEEKRAMRSKVVHDFHNAVGMQARTEMFKVDNKAGGVGVRAFYGPSESGFSNAQDAIDIARMAMRGYGVADENIQLVRRVGDEWLPISPEDVEALRTVETVLEQQGAKGTDVTSDIGAGTDEFLVQVDYDYSFNPMDVAKWSEADVKYNLFDRVPMFAGNSQGSLQRHMLDAHSMLHPNLTLGANVAVDKAAALEGQLLKIGSKFSDAYAAMKPERQQMMERYVKEANAKGLAPNTNRLVADGYSQTEIQALQDWKEYWDTMYWLENRDMARTLDSQGYMSYVDDATDTRLFAKPLGRVPKGKSFKVYDPATDTITRVSRTDVQDLYDRAGTMATLRQPIKVGDEAAEVILVNNAKGSNYLRKINDHDQVLNYREGYYSVHYKDPHFIVNIIEDSRGNTLYEKAVATAGSVKDADLMVRRMQAMDGGKYYRREDIKKEGNKGVDYWDTLMAGGRTAQRVRGKRLQDATNHITDPTMANILDPIDSMIISSRSLANRTSMRDYLEAGKARFVAQYGDLLTKDKWGRTQFPSKQDDIRKPGRENDKEVADARTSFEYLNYLEGGYINKLDDGYKAILNLTANILGEAGFTNAEKLARKAQEMRGPTGFGKNAAFNLYLALNPARQILIQSHQMLQLAPIFPKYVASGRLLTELPVLSNYMLTGTHNDLLLKAAGWTAEEATLIGDQFLASGMSAAIDRQNLMRGSLSDLASSSRLHGNKGVVGRGKQVIDFSRRVGFDAGENMNVITSWLAHRDEAARKAGTNKLDQAQLDMVTGKARNFTYNMNAAGDMPYNQNLTALVMQFQQVPHKAMTMMTTNRVLTPTQKASLVGYNALMYGLPSSSMLTLFGDVLPENEEARELALQGMEGYLLNKLLTLSTGEKTSIDFSSIAPLDAYGSYEFVTSLLTLKPGEIVANTPSGQLFFGNNPRLTNFAKSVARLTHVIDDFESPTKFSQVATEFAKLSSGFSNTFKAAYALKYGVKMNSAMTSVTDSNVTSAEALAAIFGFPTMDEMAKYWGPNSAYEESQTFEDDVNLWLREATRHLSQQGITPDKQEHMTTVMSEAFRVFGKDEKTSARAYDIITKGLARSAADGDGRLYDVMLRSQDLPNHRARVLSLPHTTEEEKQKILRWTDDMDKYEE